MCNRLQRVAPAAALPRNLIASLANARAASLPDTLGNAATGSPAHGNLSNDFAGWVGNNLAAFKHVFDRQLDRGRT